MILNSSETSGPLSNGRILEMCSLEVYVKSFVGHKVGSLEPPGTPPLPTGLVIPPLLKFCIYCVPAPSLQMNFNRKKSGPAKTGPVGPAITPMCSRV